MSAPIYTVDAFTDRPFAGNPAGVCLLSEEPDAAWMQSVAAEMNVAETAFLVPASIGYSLRWFTPTVEVELCGHATLASAHILWETGALEQGREAVFHTRSGALTAAQRGNWIELDFPAEPPRECPDPAALTEALGAGSEWAGRNRMDYLALFGSEEEVRRLNPDLSRVAALDCRGVIVTARSENSAFDYVSRFFAPQCGVPEDPVTGSAHCALAPFWSERLGRAKLTGYQVSKRGGLVRTEYAGKRVLLQGQAVTIIKGEVIV